MKASIVVSVEPGYVPLGIGGDFAENAKLIAGLGFNGVELHVDELEKIDTGRISDIAGRHGLKITGVGSGQHYVKHHLGLSTNDKEVRKRTIDRVAQLCSSHRSSRVTFISAPGRGLIPKHMKRASAILRNLCESAQKWPRN